MIGRVISVQGCEVEVRVWIRNGYFWGRNRKTNELNFYPESVIRDDESRSNVRVQQITRKIKKLL